MKNTIVKILIVLFLIVAYCFGETLFLNKFTLTMYQLARETQDEDDGEKMYDLYQQMNSCVEKNQVLLDITLPKNEMETICLSLSKVRDYIVEEQKHEARVAAGEIIVYLSAINENLNVKK